MSDNASEWTRNWKVSLENGPESRTVVGSSFFANHNTRMQRFLKGFVRSSQFLPILARRYTSSTVSQVVTPSLTATQSLPDGPQHQLVRFAELRPYIAASFANEEERSGVKIKSLPTFTNLLKGHRRGELTVFTGSTGVGKTTFLTQFALDICRYSNVPTLFGSFEIKNNRVAEVMLTQMAGTPVSEDPEKFEEVSDEFQVLPMHFLRYFGSADVNHVISALEYAVKVHKVAHVVVDNLQFMLGAINKGTEKFDAQDNAIARFRRFASEHDCHVTLVIHPRKLIGGELLSTQSIFGSAKATQEADNVIILQTNRAFRFLEICKNRYNGQLGIVPLQFHSESLTFSEWQPKDMPTEQRRAIDQLVKYNGFPVKHLDFGDFTLPAAPKLITRMSSSKDTGSTYSA